MNPHDHLRLPLVESDLARLETLLADSVIIGDEYLDQVTTHLIYAGGKRLRPLLAVSSATGGARAATDDDLLGGVALELMHLASLYHDDVMDEAEIRRNVDSVNARYGNLVAIVAGDYLMARSAAIAADLGTEIAGLLARTLAKTLNCQNPVKTDGQATDCCDECLSCRKIDRETHADIHWARPESKSRIVTVEQMRDLMQQIQLQQMQLQQMMAMQHAYPPMPPSYPPMYPPQFGMPQYGYVEMVVVDVAVVVLVTVVVVVM